LKIEPIKEEEIELKAKKIHKARMSSWVSATWSL
jgi:hypothetical protein